MKNVLWILVIVLFLGGILFWLLSQTADTPKEKETAKIVATMYPWGYFAQEIVGEDMAVQVLTPSGAEPHDFEPSPRDLAKALSADVFLWNGAGLDAWASTVPDQMKNGAVSLLMSEAITKAVQKNQKTLQKTESGEIDPHFWLDPLIAKEGVMAIRDVLQSALPTQQEDLAKRADKLLQKFDALHQEYVEAFLTCEQKTIITSHDAYEYLASRYGFKILSITGITPEEEPSAQRLADIVEQAKAHEITVVFSEPLGSSDTAETIANEISGSVLTLDPIEGLSSQTSQEDYFSLMRKNLQALQTGLACA